MANEIVVGPGEGDRRYPLLFFIPIATPIQWAGTAINVVPTPSADLPDWTAVLVSEGLITTAWLNALDGGTALFYVYTFFKDPGMSAPELLALGRSRYTEFKTKTIDNYNEVYAHAGQMFDEA